VLTSLQTVVHPEGEVKRIVFYRKNADTANMQRLMLTLSDSHLAINDVTNLRAPKLLSTVAVAPFVKGIYRVGEHLVEQITPGQDWYGKPQRNTFQIKPVTGNKPLDEREPVASFAVGGVGRVLQHDDSLLLFMRGADNYGYGGHDDKLLVYDLKNPAEPELSSTLDLGSNFTAPSYGYHYGPSGYSQAFGIANGGYSYCSYGYYASSCSSNWVLTPQGLITLTHERKYGEAPDYEVSESWTLRAVDLTDKKRPRLVTMLIDSNQGGEGGKWDGVFGLVKSGSDPSLFYVTLRDKVGEKTIDGHKFNLFRYYAAEMRLQAGKLVPGKMINLPGKLLRAYSAGDEHYLITRDNHYVLDESMVESGCTQCPASYFFRAEPRLRLLVRGQEASATLLDSHLFSDLTPTYALMADDQLFVSARPPYDYSGSWYDQDHRDRLLLFDLSRRTLDLAQQVTLDTTYTSLVGVHAKKLVLDLYGDGLLLLDTKDPANLEGLGFARTLGWVTHIAFAADKMFTAAGHFGVFEIDLADPGLFAL
jgi:hypothetical protein